MSKKIEAEHSGETILFFKYSSEEEVRLNHEAEGAPPVRMAICPHCGKASAVSKEYGPCVDAPWDRTEARQQAFRQQAESEFASSAEQLAAEETAKPVRAAYAETIARQERVREILEKTGGEVVQDARTLELRAVGRNQRLFEEKETLLYQAQLEVDQITLELTKVEQRCGRLNQRRLEKIHARVNELEQEYARSRGNGHKPPAAWNQIDWSARLRKVVGEPVAKG